MYSLLNLILYSIIEFKLFIIFLIVLQVEYLTYIIFLLYLGGLLIFFIFINLILYSSEYKLVNRGFFFENYEYLIYILLFFKLFFLLIYINENILYYISSRPFEYIPTYISNSVFYTNYLRINGDIGLIVGLFTTKLILLFLLGVIIFLVMISIVIIFKKGYNV